jgi:hypothetical protein
VPQISLKEMAQILCQKICLQAMAQNLYKICFWHNVTWKKSVYLRSLKNKVWNKDIENSELVFKEVQLKGKSTFN